MRTPQDLPRRLPRASRRTRVIAVVALVVLIVLIASLRGLANFWTDYLWFQSVGFTSVFKGVLLTKVVLSLVFITLFFGLMLTSLTVADRLSPTEVDPNANELVVRYRDFAYNRGLRIRVVVSLIFAVLGGIGADRQWNHWDLFRYRVSFGVTDQQFHKDVGFYVFELPFIRFLVGWAFDAVVVIFIVTTVFHYLNGGINVQAPRERVRPAVKAHLSVLLGVLALIKAVGYYYDRLALVLSRSHVVDGATATSVHADAPAKFLLIFIAIVSAGFFLANIRQRGWVLPAVGVGLWALVSVLLGAAYPAVYQALRVKPSELTRETPYLIDNINATRAAYGLDQVATPSGYSYSPTLSSSEVAGNSPQAQVNQQTISNVRLLDPAVNLLNTFNKYQSQRAYYSFNNLDLDRYNLAEPNGSSQETATVTSIRELNSSVPSGFVNQHLQYTHGYGAIQSPIGESGVNSDGTPNFTLSGLPPTSQQSATRLSPEGSQIYFGEGPDTGGYVIADSKTPELNYEDSAGNQTSITYQGKGGVDAGSLVRRAAFALRFGDANFVLSGQITPTSKVMYYRNILQRVQKAAPFLRYDSDPYSVVLNGKVYWVIDAYTITNNYPYSQQANLDGLPPNSGLQTKFNYVRNSVKVVVSAYDGSMHFFDMGTNDPILKVYERAFPDLFTPVSRANSIYPGITSHWRYPENIFQIQTNMFGRYHLTNPSDFYSQAQAWAVSPDPGSGALNSNTAIGSTVLGSNGQPVVQVNRLQPQYIEAAPPNTKQQGVNFLLITPFVPISATGSSQNLTAFMTASSDQGAYGRLSLYELPAGVTVDGPGLISNAIRSNTAISSELTLYDQSGSLVELGEVDVVPVDQTLLYIEPVYVESTSAHIPTLDDVVVVYNGKAYHSQNSGLDNALCQIQNPDGSKPFASTYCNTAFAQESPNLPINGTAGGGSGSSSSTSTSTTTPPTTSGTVPPGATVQSLLAQANQDLANAQAALAQQNLGQYEADVKAATQAIKQANSLPPSGSSGRSNPSPPSSPTTSTSAPPASTATTTPKS
jgi:uncharacterized membrane protein (UPF0182 family)